MRLRVHINLLFMAILLMALLSCTKDSNPAVPPAPVGDITSTITRNPSIRIGLLSFTPQKHLFVTITRGSFNCFIGDASQQILAAGRAGEVLEFTGADTSIDVGSGQTSVAEGGNQLNNKILRIEPDAGIENGSIEVGPTKSTLRAYRGKFRLLLEGKDLIAVNEVQLEDYLLGVVPAEMDPSWPAEALKAQAVASRTYALFNLGRYATRGFDLADDERSQLYGGISVESDTTTKAVVETTNEVVTIDNKLACVVFHRESGGQTASNLDVWPHSGDVKYLEGVSDKLGVTDFSANGRYSQWSSTATFDQLKRRFQP